MFDRLLQWVYIIITVGLYLYFFNDTFKMWGL